MRSIGDPLWPADCYCLCPHSHLQGMRSIGPFVAERFLEIVKARNKMARLLGFEDFYDYKVHVCMYLGLLCF